MCVSPLVSSEMSHMFKSSYLHFVILAHFSSFQFAVKYSLPKASVNLGSLKVQRKCSGSSSISSNHSIFALARIYSC